MKNIKSLIRYFWSAFLRFRFIMWGRFRGVLAFSRSVDVSAKNPSVGVTGHVVRAALFFICVYHANSNFIIVSGHESNEELEVLNQ